jgi:hypothetical protein
MSSQNGRKRRALRTGAALGVSGLAGFAVSHLHLPPCDVDAAARCACDLVHWALHAERLRAFLLICSGVLHDHPWIAFILVEIPTAFGLYAQRRGRYCNEAGEVNGVLLASGAYYIVLSLVGGMQLAATAATPLVPWSALILRELPGIQGHWVVMGAYAFIVYWLARLSAVLHGRNTPLLRTALGAGLVVILVLLTLGHGDPWALKFVSALGAVTAFTLVVGAARHHSRLDAAHWLVPLLTTYAVLLFFRPFVAHATVDVLLLYYGGMMGKFVVDLISPDDLARIREYYKEIACATKRDESRLSAVSVTE